MLAPFSLVFATVMWVARAQESKRGFLHDIVNEEGDKGKLESFINFCEDTIFEVVRSTLTSSVHDVKQLLYRTNICVSFVCLLKNAL